MNTIVLCPGFHSPELTHTFLASLQVSELSANWLVFPSARYLPYSSLDVLRFVQERLKAQAADAWLQVPLTFVGFSAGVVGAIGAALAISTLGGRVRSLFALDGWGVPLMGNFPMHRLSHDYVTHWSSALLGTGQENFYADPGVEHLELWRSPDTVRGLWVSPQQTRSTTAAQFLTYWLQSYEQMQH